MWCVCILALILLTSVFCLKRRHTCPYEPGIFTVVVKCLDETPIERITEVITSSLQKETPRLPKTSANSGWEVWVTIGKTGDLYSVYMSLHSTHHHGNYSTITPWHTKTSDLDAMAKAIERSIPQWLPRAISEYHQLTPEELKERRRQANGQNEP